MNTNSIPKLLLLVALAANPLVSPAQDFPDRPIRLILPATPGNLTDIMLRSMATKMSETLNRQPIIVENQPGAGTVVGTAAVARALPDGYTWGIGAPGAFAVNPYLMKSVPYDPLKDFEAICRIGAAPYILAVNASLGVKSLPELLAKAKASPPLSFASSGSGSQSHMAQELFKFWVGGQFLHVPYKGTAQAVSDTVAGHTQVIFDTFGGLGPHIKSGKLIPIAITSARRLGSVPDVPTFAELGYKEVLQRGWIGLVAPARTPAPVIAKVAAACMSAVASPDIVSHAQSNGFEIDYASPKEFGDFIAMENKRWGELIQRAGIKAE